MLKDMSPPLISGDKKLGRPQRNFMLSKNKEQTVQSMLKKIKLNIHTESYEDKRKGLLLK